jgi:RNA polymerase sigma factor (sigma-70 family)
VDPVLEGFLAEDRQALGRVERLADRVVSSPRFGLPPEDRRDVVQETLLDLWSAVERPGFDVERPFEPFVCSVACRRAIDWLRRKRRTEPLVDSPAPREEGPEARTLHADRLRLGRLVLLDLGRACRELIRLHAVERRTWADIGRQLGRSEGALRVHMHGCLRKARECLERRTRPG